MEKMACKGQATPPVCGHVPPEGGQLRRSVWLAADEVTVSD